MRAKLRRARQGGNAAAMGPRSGAGYVSAAASDLAATSHSVDVLRNPTVHIARGLMRKLATLFVLLLTLPPVAVAQTASKDRAAPVARFDWFEYSGRDSVYDVHP